MVNSFFLNEIPTIVRTLNKYIRVHTYVRMHAVFQKLRLRVFLKNSVFPLLRVISNCFPLSYELSLVKIEKILDITTHTYVNRHY